MFGFIKKVLDFFGVDQSEDNPSETAVETTDVSTKVKTTDTTQEESSVKTKTVVPTQPRGSVKPETIAPDQQKKHQIKTETTTGTTKQKSPKVTLMDGHVKQYYFARRGETSTHDTSLPPPVKVLSGRSIPLKEIPFEATRNELVQIYLTSIDQLIKSNKLNSVPSQQIASHYLFLRSLANSETDGIKKNQILSLAKPLGNYLASKEPHVWKMINELIEKSEYPIIHYLKNNRAHSNFMLALIHEYHKEPLTKNQSAFVQKFRDSSVFLFPNSIYTAWLAHSYDDDSSFNPMFRERLSTNFYHSTLTDNLLLRTEPKEVTLSSEHHYKKEKGPIDSSFRYQMSSDRLLRIQGRTLLFSTPQNDVVAVKVQKKGEPKSTLEEEFQMADYLLKHQRRLDVHSKLPQPLGQYSVKKSEILEISRGSLDFERFKTLIDDSKDLEVYVYKAPQSYFTYLHDKNQDLEDLTASVKTNVHDLFVLLREGIVFPQLADIFHTHFGEDEREDKGRYQALVQLLNVLQFQLGRIDKWQKAVEYVNLRSSGLADLGDSLPITSLFTSSDFTKHYFSELLTGGYHPTFFDKSSGTANSLFTGKRRLFGNYLYLNTIAEYLLVIQLTLGSYGDKVTRDMMDKPKKEAVWRELTNVMFTSCAEAIHIMTGIPQSRALTLLKQRANIEKHFRQTQFWMTPDYSKLDEDTLQMEQYSIYSGEPEYEFTDKLVSGVGLSVDGVHQDLGGYNRESPLRELEKLLYATVTLIEGTMQLDKEFFKQLQQVEKILSGEIKTDANSCFEAVAQLLDLARPGCHFQKRLVLSYYEEAKLKYPSAPTDAYDSRFQVVAKTNAAITIQRFWREARKNLSENSDIDSEKPESERTSDKRLQ
ncbi:T4SS meta-effector polyglutamylase SidJ [Legionella pneumophila serogroup 1]|uniref:T4SS meta-effector polyglutamylase SidJ n=1 Tax=Legionella pneumophila TaxID=446 RepID=UPI000770B5EB|nr:T4SS meta-effector polyglutamylase SidJ [Legionella pneumophila]HAT8946654.1 T4SS meta-effector polyglutamylase SidJ [Legionella pneumophila subsp. pneumophila]MCH9061904.1 T4SS meta-effector polyglutamylase SidJ [Legionella pneumophila serogroup 1]MCH9064977.1 T4SS meta-effector polyglutamylase SidJ [Legionella pneumophila serogroup 1]MCH9067975.1 T4SS meta-effector polyglutamylase SidJ [Legionella pneumophila serogroup 1]MCH9069397.1 T4SS meta-effector polyglutamylase SidJ [Legionella pne